MKLGWIPFFSLLFLGVCKKIYGGSANLTFYKTRLNFSFFFVFFGGGSKFTSRYSKIPATFYTNGNVDVTWRARP